MMLSMFFISSCQRYLGHVDLMKFLVESNCGDIPSLRDLMRQDSARCKVREGKVLINVVHEQLTNCNFSIK